ncbi:type 1 glutamine amidotransferase [Tropicimonas sp.]|uniref:type 1 glutamine amidotransferase n=1 Tax=Tropicimonas sp. TaxID=2067044 RepID=UPI003A874B64
MLIGILQTGLPPEDAVAEHGDYPEMFETLLAGHGLRFRTWLVVNGEFPDSVADADGWLITGSRHGVYEDHPWIAPLERFIRAVRADGRPMVGICFGHQIMAQALGGKVEKFAGGWSIGPTAYRWDGREITLNAWHQDQVVEPPDGAEVIAATDFCRFAGLAYGDQMLSLQPHPEFSPGFIDALIRLRGQNLPDDMKGAALAALDLPNDSRLAGDRIARFFLEHRKPAT